MTIVYCDYIKMILQIDMEVKQESLVLPQEAICTRLIRCQRSGQNTTGTEQATKKEPSHTQGAPLCRDDGGGIQLSSPPHSPRRIHQPAEDLRGRGGPLGQVPHILHPLQHEHRVQAVAEGGPALPPHLPTGVVPVRHQVHVRAYARGEPRRNSTCSRSTRLPNVATETVAASLV